MHDEICYGILILGLGCQVSVVSILNGLWARWPINCGSVPGTCKRFISSQSIQTGSGTNRAFYSVGTTTLFFGKSSQGVELTTHLLLVMRLRMRGAIPPIPHMPSRHMHENFTFVLLSVMGMFTVAYNMPNV